MAKNNFWWIILGNKNILKIHSLLLLTLEKGFMADKETKKVKQLTGSSFRE